MEFFDKTVAAPDEAKHTNFVILIEELKNDHVLRDVSVVELTLTDSLLAPSIQATIKMQDGVHTNPMKNLDKFAGKKVLIAMKRPILALYGHNDVLETELVIYRLSDRKLMSDNVEKYNLHACDGTLLLNSMRRVSKSWASTLPSAIASEVLSSSVNAPRMDIESVGPIRSYIAENIHPFQVVAQQADVALYGGNDPCLLHYMSLKNSGTHHFRSLKSLTSAPSVFTFSYFEKGSNDVYAFPEAILAYQFPCDFDVLSDIENGINIDGSENVSFLSINPFNYLKNILGNGINSLGFGAAIHDFGFTNKQTGAGTPDIGVEDYARLRQARLSLLDHDKMALQIVVPFNPNIYSGAIITCNFMNKATTPPSPDYGSGTYLVTTVAHSVKTNGVGISVIDCVSRGVGLSG